MTAAGDADESGRLKSNHEREQNAQVRQRRRRWGRAGKAADHRGHARYRIHQCNLGVLSLIRRSPVTSVTVTSVITATNEFGTGAELPLLRRSRPRQRCAPSGHLRRRVHGVAFRWQARRRSQAGPAYGRRPHRTELPNDSTESRATPWQKLLRTACTGAGNHERVEADVRHDGVGPPPGGPGCERPSKPRRGDGGDGGQSRPLR